MCILEDLFPANNIYNVTYLKQSSGSLFFWLFPIHDYKHKRWFPIHDYKHP